MSAEAPSPPGVERAERAESVEAARLGSVEAASIWARHLTSLLLPVNALAFLFTGPHPWYLAPLFMLPVVVAFVVDDSNRVERGQPSDLLPAWPFDALVYLLAALQLLVIVGIAQMFAVQAIFSVDMVVMITVVGGSSGFSIITAHELIHRRKPWERNLGRLLLCTVLQEHFFTEHLRGHHVRIGTPDDPATAHFGEDYASFYRRTVPAQFRSAWRLEKKRLGDEQMSILDPRMIQNRIVHGILVGWGVAVWMGVAVGLAALVAFLLQAFFSSRLLEAVNYFEHWGLTREGSRIRPSDSWDTHSWFTYYGLTGLSRHADHHYEQARPFQQLRVYEDVPMLPSGYVAMVDMVMTKNAEFQRLASQELERCRLGPFTEGRREGRESGEAAPERGPTSTGSGGRLRQAWRELPAAVRLPIVAAVFLTAVTVGAGWLGESAMGLAATWLWNALILAAFVVVFRVVARIEQAGSGPILGWSVGLALLAALGVASERALALLL